ncbi:MAG: hypothetical protein MZV70_43275 [Desulfobacterales bacterium]|nr:hypothetical protein [Desulfobacterales bacterium]
MGLSYNRLLYNRHPMITPNRLPKRILFRRSWHSDNSFYLDDPGAADYMIIAGSPEWRIGGRMEALFRFVLENSVPCAFLAVGAGSGARSAWTAIRMNCCAEFWGAPGELVTVRDENAGLALGAYGPKLPPCTALFAAKSNRLRTGPGVVGLVFQNCTQRFNSVSPATHAQLVGQYRKIMERHGSCRVICHTATDFTAALQAFPGADIRYSALAEDYEGIYDACDFVIGPRVHGSGMAASLRDTRHTCAAQRQGAHRMGFQVHLRQTGRRSPRDDGGCRHQGRIGAPA